MSDTIRRTWNDIAYHWDDWASPLRPAPEDLRVLRSAVECWQAGRADRLVSVYLCGVTPEIATLDWPFPVRLTAVDRSESMVRVVWPGDVPGSRRAVVGNWLQPPLPPHSQHVAVVDGGYGFFDCPDGQRALTTALWTSLRPGGLLWARLYTRAVCQESLAEVLDAARAGRMGNFHVFKFRVAAALQADSRRGVRLDDVWHACTGAGLDPAALPQPGWSARAVDTIRFYRGGEACLYFPTLDEFRSVVSERFENVQVVYPEYEFGDRCPIITAVARG